MQSNTAAQISTIAAKPILKWAGGKTQMLGELLPKVPSSYGRYIEPFFGGGALFFALQPENAVIADSNPELINMYRQVADHVDNVISYLEKYQNTSEMFYSVRSLDWETLPKAEAAARTIYLNRTCYNGLYRVNKKGQFNVTVLLIRRLIWALAAWMDLHVRLTVSLECVPATMPPILSPSPCSCLTVQNSEHSERIRTI